MVAGVKRVVCLSTDKAVYPINAMGISKAMMEKVMVASSRNLEGTNTVICGTRYEGAAAQAGLYAAHCAGGTYGGGGVGGSRMGGVLCPNIFG